MAKPAPPAFGAADFAQALANLMPPGAAWPRDPSSLQQAALRALAPTYARSTAAAAQLLADAFPTTTLYLLPEWERSLGLPDACAPAAPTLRQRQAAVAAKWAQRAGQTPAYFAAFAAALGYAVTITQYAPFRFGSTFGLPLNGPAWAAAWQVHAPTFSVQSFQFGHDAFGEPFATWGNTQLQCELGRLKPAHTTLIFSYS